MSGEQFLRSLTVAAIACSVACATVVAGGSNHVMVASNPAGATVLVDDREVGRTPTRVELERSSKGEIRIELPGFQPFRVSVRKRINGWLWANFALGGLIGIAIDFATGAALRFDESAIAVGLTPRDGHGVALPAPADTPKLDMVACRDARAKALREAYQTTDEAERRQRVNRVNATLSCR